MLLQTKLHQPRVTADLVHRPRLKEVLDNGLDRPLILVAAPAGFGKSTLVSAWLETCDLPHAWISLDEVDNDLGVFLAYFLAAMQILFPDALPETQALLNGITLPAVGVIARSLINELDALERDFILALDAFHLIRDQAVHELLGLLLQHPPQGLRLVIATRQDPPLSLGVFRARHQVAEIRGHDLRFSVVETATFVERTLGAPLAIEVLALKALLHDAQGDERAALAQLQQTVALAEPDGFIRLFVDLGPRLARGDCQSDPPWPAVRPQPLHYTPHYILFYTPKYDRLGLALLARSRYA